MVLLAEAQDEKADSISVSDGGFELSVLYDFVSMIGPQTHAAPQCSDVRAWLGL